IAYRDALEFSRINSSKIVALISCGCYETTIQVAGDRRKREEKIIIF
ncbi:801_t:CDS:1, partial [Racocetra persica]